MNPAMSQNDTSSRCGTPHWKTIAIVLTAILLLPLSGRWLAGRSVQSSLEFPPLTHDLTHAVFSWPVFIGLAILMICLLAPLIARVAQSNCRSSAANDPAYTSQGTFHQRPVHGRFPRWGWLAVCWTLLAWWLAWTRYEWMRPLQAHTFTPLWLGYIVIVNALTYRRTGHCMLVHRPRYLFSLFPLSACFWWSFEYLNRFVQNWYYVGGEELTAGEYLLRATLSFSTVLPAVLGTAEWLTTFPRLSAGLDRLVRLDFNNRKQGGWVILCVAVGGLVGLGLWPDYLFALVWVVPLLLIIALQLIRDAPTIFSETAHGDGRTLWAVALAALICGWFWEMWNVYSLMHWEYAVPYVQRFELFQMPLLGYAGYLPFGLECLAVADLCLARKFSGGVAYYGAVEAGRDLAQRKPTVAER